MAVLPIEYSIKLSDYTADSNEKQILNSLSINNIKNIYQLRIYLKAGILLNVQETKRIIYLPTIKVVHPKVSGEHIFQEFSH